MLVRKHGDTDFNLQALRKYILSISKGVEGERRAGCLWSMGRVCQNLCFISWARYMTAFYTCYVFWLSSSFLKHFHILFFTLLVLHELEYVLIGLSFSQFLIGILYKSKLTIVLCGSLYQLIERKTFVIDRIPSLEKSTGQWKL